MPTEVPSPTCARPTCSAQATVRFLHDGQAAILVLDRRVLEYGGSGVLCDLHANSLKAPKGWTVDDRRVRAPRLFSVTRFDDPSHQGPGPHERRARGGHHANATPLPLDDEVPDYAPSAVIDRTMYSTTDSAVDSMNESTSPQPIVVHPNQSSFDLPDKRTPLLARAFESAGQRVRTTSSLSSLIPRDPQPQTATG